MRKIKNSSNDIWLFDLTGKILLFLFYFISSSFFLYLIGNKQLFLDKTQIMLLKFIDYTGSFFIVLTVFFIIGRIMEWVFFKEARKKDIIISFFGVGIIAAIFSLTKFILVLAS